MAATDGAAVVAPDGADGADGPAPDGPAVAAPDGPAVAAPDGLADGPAVTDSDEVLLSMLLLLLLAFSSPSSCQHLMAGQDLMILSTCCLARISVARIFAMLFQTVQVLKAHWLVH